MFMLNTARANSALCRVTTTATVECYVIILGHSMVLGLCIYVGKVVRLHNLLYLHDTGEYVWRRLIDSESAERKYSNSVGEKIVCVVCMGWGAGGWTCANIAYVPTPIGV